MTQHIYNEYPKSRYSLNLVIFNQQLRTQASPAIVIGAVLPDIPIFVFYFLMKFVYHLPTRHIWSEVYYQPFWQAIVSTFHSIPLALLGILIAHVLSWQLIEVGFTSMVLHSLLDLPLDNNDAHRPFFPSVITVLSALFLIGTQIIMARSRTRPFRWRSQLW
ncbi:hypothetical protein [Nostoc sp. CHAB 5715]|uniref:hypothetical protein n=1 Tax=Nostoc sp. CHAB 5715 TaxID=2780400 RepID=UPI001E51D07A|nr:hypothetical protein [Nostoc sp. CHAB 5715]MCC5621762.1 hypothetical protein [Nostoc sp. CHAB 5715]